MLVCSDTQAEEVGVGASPAVQCVAVLETVAGAGAEAQYAALVQETGGGLP